MFLRKLLDLKDDVAHTLMGDDSSARDKIEATLDKRRYQLATIA